MALKRQTLQAVAALAAMFVLGAVAGAGLMRALQIRAAVEQFERGPDEAHRRALETVLRERLDLDEAQSVAVREVLRSQASGQRALRRRVEPEARALRVETAARIRRLLRPEQRPAFDALARDHERQLLRWLAAEPGAR